MLHILWSLITGFIVGLLARALLPGADQMGFLATSLLGIAGSVVGGLIGRLIRPPEEGAAFHPAGFFMSIVGAIILLWAFRSVQRSARTIAAWRARGGAAREDAVATGTIRRA